MTLKMSDSAAYEAATPTLSVLVPFFRDDCAALIQALDAELTDQVVEILVYDDGTGDSELTQKTAATVTQAKRPVRLITNSENQGRSGARNGLFQAARAEWVLFLDADMLPSHSDFLQNYLTLISESNAEIIFGGFEVEASSEDADRDLHRALSEVSDCLTLSERQAAGPQYVASSNLCVHRDVLIAQPFDSNFEGWGWEDSEWAARVAKHFTLIHADNSAIHLGLETTDTLLKRFATSGTNYLRFTEAHPDLATNLALYKISKKLGRVPAQSLMRPLLKTCVKMHAMPMKVRLAALKLWRASHYAAALS